LFEHEWGISNHFPPPNPQLTLQLTCSWLGHALWTLSLQHLMKWLQNETLAYTSSIKWYDDLHLNKDLISLQNPD
jgi:hypothetical protein